MDTKLPRIQQGFEPAYVNLKHLPKSKFAILQNDLTYTSRRGRKHTAHRGMMTDGGTKPRFLWRLMGQPFDDLLLAYVIHDKYCKMAWDVARSGNYWLACNIRDDADALFREMVEHLGAGRVEAASYYRGVRTGALTARLRWRSMRRKS